MDFAGFQGKKEENEGKWPIVCFYSYDCDYERERLAIVQLGHTWCPQKMFQDFKNALKYI